MKPNSESALAASFETVRDADGNGFRLADFLDCLGRWARAAQFTCGLNPAQWESLRFLDRANRLSRTPGALAKYLGTTRGTASQTLLALEKKGYISRSPDPSDRRGVYLDVTDAGVELLRQDPLACVDDVLMSRIDSKTAATIAESLGHVMSCFQSASLGQTFGTCDRCGHFVASDATVSAHCRLKKADLADGELAGICVNFVLSEKAAALDART